MIKAIAHIEESKVIALDIETVRLAEKFADADPNVQEAWKYKNKFEGAVPEFDKLSELWEKSASLYAEFSKVCAVSLAYISNGVLKVKNYASYDEKVILLSLGKDLSKFDGSYRLCAHAGNYFDYPYLFKRFLVNGIQCPGIIDSSNAKPWEKTNIDTNDIWKSAGTGPGSSLFALCVALGIPISKVDMVGDEVGKAYYEGKLKEISDYCALDTIACMNVFLRLKGRRIFEFDMAQYVNKGEILPNFLDGLYQTKKLTADSFTIIKQFNDTLDEAGQANLYDILCAALFNNGGISIENQSFLDQL